MLWVEMLPGHPLPPSPPPQHPRHSVSPFHWARGVLAAACLGGFCVAGWGHGTATAAPPASSADSAPAAAEPLGLQVQNLAPWTVLAVQGLAARAGLHPGDHVLAVNGQPLNRLDQLPTSLSRETSSAALLVERDGREIFIPLHWP